MKREIGKITLASLLTLQQANRVEAGHGSSSIPSGTEQREVQAKQSEHVFRNFIDDKLERIEAPTDDVVREIIKRSSLEHDLKGERLRYVVEVIADKGGYRIINLLKSDGKFLFDPRNEYWYVVSGSMLEGGIASGEKTTESMLDIMPKDSDGNPNLDWFYGTYSPVPVHPSMLSSIKRYKHFKSITVASPGVSYVVHLDNLKETDSLKFKRAVNEWERILMKHIRQALDHFTDVKLKELKESGEKSQNEDRRSYMRLIIQGVRASLVLREDCYNLKKDFDDLFERYGIRLTVEPISNGKRSIPKDKQHVK